MSPLIIGFGYKARHGKDTAAQAILEMRSHEGRAAKMQQFKDTPLGEAFGRCTSYDIRIYKYATALKKEVTDELTRMMVKSATADEHMDTAKAVELANRELCLRHGAMYDPKAPMDDPDCPYGKQRHLLQLYGTEFRRAQDNDYWVKKLMAQIEEEKPEVALITDMRFLNEVKAIKERGGFVCKIEREGYALPVATQHASETELDNYDDWDTQTLVPEGALDQLKQSAVTLFDIIHQQFQKEQAERFECSDPGDVSDYHTRSNK
jgi:hypothetical protein